MKTRTAPWDYVRIQVRLPIHDIQLEYFMLLNKLERDYGIDYISGIVKSWGKIDYQEKLDRTILLEYELEHGECTCTPDLPDGRCFPLCDVCKADVDRRYGDSIPIGGE